MCVTITKHFLLIFHLGLKIEMQFVDIFFKDILFTSMHLNPRPSAFSVIYNFPLNKSVEP